MGFNKMFSGPPTVSTPPPTVTETQPNDSQEDYAQRASHKRGLLSTILTNRNRATADASSGNAGGSKTLG